MVQRTEPPKKHCAAPRASRIVEINNNILNGLQVSTLHIHRYTYRRHMYNRHNILRDKSKNTNATLRHSACVDEKHLFFYF